MPKDKFCFFLFLFILFYIATADGSNITFTYNTTVTAGVNFSAYIELLNFSNDAYDIKIDITNSTGSRISQIYDNGTWKSTFNYVLKAINTTISNNSTFLLNITEQYNGTANITVKVRKNGKTTSVDFDGFFANVIMPSATAQQNQSQQNQTSNNQTNQSTQTTPQDTNQTSQQGTQTTGASETIVLILPQNVSTDEIFNITVKLFNLKNKPYDLKVEMEKDDTLISDIYNPIEKDWQSSYYYMQNFTLGNENRVDNLTLKIKEKFLSIYGTATLRVKLRSGSTQITAKSEEIALVKKLDAKLTNKSSNGSLADSQFNSISGNVVKSKPIRLNQRKETEDIKSNSYISVKQFIKEYAIYGFVALCIVIIILLKPGVER